MKPKYKVGDKVRIVKRTEKASNYRFVFIDEMAILEGQVYKISYIDNFSPDSHPVPDDGYYYELKGSGSFIWASSMFELVEEAPPQSKEEYKEDPEEEPKVLDFTHKKKYYQLNFSV